MRKRSLLSAGVAIGALALPVALGTQVASATAGTAPAVHAVVAHLNNPRGLAVESNGRIWIAEAGQAGTSCQGAGANATCVGLTSSVSKFAGGKLTRVLNGLISVGGPGGIASEGAVAVALDHGDLAVIMAASAFEVPPSGFPRVLLNTARAELGQLIHASKAGPWGTAAAVGSRDYIWTRNHKFLQPDQFPDANPNGVTVVGNTVFVADAGANLLAQVGARGAVRTLAYFQVPKGSITDAVPTCVAQGPDGALYVGELLGGTFAPGGARVWRVTMSGGTAHAKVWATGFTTIQGCGFDKWGNFYATEFQTGGLDEDQSASPLGDVVKVDTSGHRTHLGTGSLFWPSGFAAGSDGSIYVSNCSIAPASGFGPCPNGGEVVRIG
jgi:hypothetical protein